MRIALPGLFDLQVNGFGGIDFNAPDLTRDRAAEALDRMRRDRRDTLPAHAHHVVLRTLRGERTRSGSISRIPRSPGSTWKGRTFRPRRGRARRPSPSGHCAGQRRRLSATPGRRRRPHPSSSRSRRKCRGRCRSSSISSRRACASPSGIRSRRRLRLARRLRAGASLATHLGNGCPQMLPRHPNVIWELLAADAVFASLIVDGHHLPAGDGQSDDSRERLESDDSRDRCRGCRRIRPGPLYAWRRGL